MQPDNKQPKRTGGLYAGYECENCGHIEYRAFYGPDRDNTASVFIDCPKCKQRVAINLEATVRNNGKGMATKRLPLYAAYKEGRYGSYPLWNLLRPDRPGGTA